MVYLQGSEKQCVGCVLGAYALRRLRERQPLCHRNPRSGGYRRRWWWRAAMVVAARAAVVVEMLPALPV